MTTDDTNTARTDTDSPSTPEARPASGPDAAFTIDRLSAQLLDALEERLADEVALAVMDGHDGLDVVEVESNGHVDGHPKLELRCRAWSDAPPTETDCTPIARVDFREYTTKSLCRFIARNGGDPRDA